MFQKFDHEKLRLEISDEFFKKTKANFVWALPGPPFIYLGRKYKVDLNTY